MSDSFIFSRTARLLVPVLFVLSCVTLYRGHHLPGGGFIGGLMAASGFLLVALAGGVDAARRLLRVDPATLIVGGLLVAFAAGGAGLVIGGAWLEGLWLPAFDLPMMGEIHLGTPMLFDAGVYLTVAGVTLHIAFAMLEVRS